MNSTLMLTNTTASDKNKTAKTEESEKDELLAAADNIEDISKGKGNQ